MAVKRIVSEIDVLTAAKMRVKNVFSNGVPVYLSFSGGKDSIVLADITYRLILSGEIDAKLLTVIFLDEEAVYQDVINMTMAWRKRFLSVGAKFEWFCVEVKHFSAYNQLTQDESFICWDRRKENVWVRRPPPFAIRSHPMLRIGIDNYQAFFPRIHKDGITICGTRAYESIQRLLYMSYMELGTKKEVGGRQIILPIYDWRDNDIWFYLRENKVDIPINYLWMYQVGTQKQRLRISQFFSVDCIGSLIHMAEYEPGLWERILRREPNAYMAALYWDSELYKRTSKSRREEEKKNPKDYKALVWRMLFEKPEEYFTTKLGLKTAEKYKRLVIRFHTTITQTHYRDIYNGLIGGDPKGRTYRAIYMNIAKDYAEYSKKFRKGGERLA